MNVALRAARYPPAMCVMRYLHKYPDRLGKTACAGYTLINHE
jgi:hypothetical protein